MKKFIFLWLSLLGYTALSFILMLRDQWALKTAAQFYPQLQGFLFSARKLALNFHLNTLPTLIFALLVALSFFFYWKLLKSKWVKKQSHLKILLLSAILQITLFVSYPALSTDVFDYILLNRTAFVHGSDPWITAPINFPQDPFINLGSWQDISSVYGPTFHLASILPAMFGLDDLVGSVLGFKLLMIIFSLLTLVVLIKLLPGKNSGNKLALFAFNPLFLIESAGNAHNDIIMVFFMLASYWAYKKDKYFLTGVLVSLGMMVKLYAVVLIGFYLLFAKGKTFRSMVSRLLLGFLAASAFGVWIMGIEAVISQADLMLWVFSLRLNSLPNLVNKIPNLFFLLPFLTFSLILIFKKRKTSLIKIYVKLTVIYLLFVVPLYWAWYPIWYLPFLPLFPMSKLTKSGIALSLTSQLHYALLFLSHRFNYQSFLWTVAIYLLIAIPPIYIYAFSKNGKRN